MINIHEKFGERIRSLRKKGGLTQTDLAGLASLSLKHIGEIERGRGNPTLDSLEKLSLSLGLSLKDMFNFE